MSTPAGGDRPGHDQHAQHNDAAPALSLLNQRFGALANAAPVTSFFKSFVDPVVVVITLYLLCGPFDESFDGNHKMLAVVAFLLSAQFLDGIFLFVPGDTRPWLGVGKFLGGWALIVAFLWMLGAVTGLSVSFYPPYILTWFVVAPLVLIVTHAGCRFLLFRAEFRQRPTRRVVIVGASRVGQMLAQKIHENPELNMTLLGYFDDRKMDRLHGVQVDTRLGAINDLPAYVEAQAVHHIYITLPMTSQPRVMVMLQALQDSTASIYFVPDFFIFDLIQARFDHVVGLPVIAVCESPFVGISGIVKRLSDIVLALVILALIWPLMLAVAVAVKVTSRGPVLFKQRRYGNDGESIVVYKFRSMTVQEDGAKVVQAQRGDSRFTVIGGFLRRTSLDELPQFINVLEGKMSIVGPRPHANAHNEFYRKQIRGYMMRHKVKPGITGWAQVNGCRGETETLEKMQRRVDYDLDYLRNWSLWLDLKIVLMTMFMVIRDKNAY